MVVATHLPAQPSKPLRTVVRSRGPFLQLPAALPSSPPHSQPDKEARPSRSGGKEEGGWRAWACCLPRRGHGSSGGAGLAADGPKARALRSWRAWGGNRSGLNEQLFPLLPCTTLLWLLFLCSVRETWLIYTLICLENAFKWECAKVTCKYTHSLPYFEGVSIPTKVNKTIKFLMTHCPSDILFFKDIVLAV